MIYKSIQNHLLEFLSPPLPNLPLGSSSIIGRNLLKLVYLDPFVRGLSGFCSGVSMD